MLFIPWRNEETGFVGSFSSYQELDMLLSNVISKQMEKYAICKETFMKKKKKEFFTTGGIV